MNGVQVEVHSDEHLTPDFFNRENRFEDFSGSIRRYDEKTRETEKNPWLF